MKRFVFVLAISLILVSCGDDEPDSDITKLQEEIDALQDEIKTLKDDVVPANLKEPDTIKEDIGGLPPSGEPTGDPVDKPKRGVPVFGGGKIVFCSNSMKGHETRNIGIYLMDSNGAAVTFVVKPPGDFKNPTLSPNGESIAYTSTGEQGGYPAYIHHIESGRSFRLTEDNGLYPAWSPDGTQIVYENRFNLFITSTDPFNPEVFQLTHNDNAPHTTPTWSPDGEQIAFASTLDGNYNIFAIDADGRNQIRFTNHPSDDSHPDWSPDGRQIAFQSHRFGTWDIFVVDTETFIETQLTDSQGDYREPSWSPDSSKIAMGESEIYIINANGTGLTNITNSVAYESAPDWQ